MGSWFWGRTYYLKSGRALPGTGARNDGINEPWSEEHVEGHVAQIIYLLTQAGKVIPKTTPLWINNFDGPCFNCADDGLGRVGRILPKGYQLKVYYRLNGSSWKTKTIIGRRS